MDQDLRLSVKVILDQMTRLSRPFCEGGKPPALELARVLLVHGELAPRLTLQTILEAGGYSVDAVATPAEALSKLDEREYQLVLSDADLRARPAGGKVLSYARVKSSRPATALITSYRKTGNYAKTTRPDRVSICTENLPGLLLKVADLIGFRASRRYRMLRQA